MGRVVAARIGGDGRVIFRWGVRTKKNARFREKERTNQRKRLRVKTRLSLLL